MGHLDRVHHETGGGYVSRGRDMQQLPAGFVSPTDSQYRLTIAELVGGSVGFLRPVSETASERDTPGSVVHNPIVIHVNRGEES